MLIVSANIGHYSIKILTAKQERNKLNYLNSYELILNYKDDTTSSDTPRLTQQHKVLQNFLNELTEDYYLICNVPNEIFTTRFLDLPVKNKKKASLMVPFKLEEDVPMSLSECHLGMAMRPTPMGVHATVHISSLSDYSPFFHSLKQNKLSPRLLTSELSATQTFVEKYKDEYPSSFAIINIGHDNTTAYYFSQGQLVSTHMAFFGGATINEMIRETYNISDDDAVIFKHQNSFFLTQDQYASVNEDQRHFAMLMEKTIHPLINEIHRWELGFRVAHGVRIKEIFITGGTSKIRNIDGYLTQELGLEVKHLDLNKLGHFNKLPPSKQLTNISDIAFFLSQSFFSKSLTVNFLSGPFNIDNGDELPLHSYFFWTSRLSAVTALLIMGLMVEKISLYRDLKVINAQIFTIAKNPVLELTAREKRLATTDTALLHRKFLQKKKYINQEISTLQSAVNINAVTAIVQLANIINGSMGEIIQFDAISGGDFSALIKVNAPEQMVEVVKALENSGIKNVFVDKNEENLTVTVSGVE